MMFQRKLVHIQTSSFSVGWDQRGSVPKSSYCPKQLQGTIQLFFPLRNNNFVDEIMVEKTLHGHQKQSFSKLFELTKCSMYVGQKRAIKSKMKIFSM